jgi:carboxyl-terminal processing protease
MKSGAKKLSRKIIIGLSVLVLSTISFKAADDYFEISKNLDVFATLYKEVNTYYVDDTKPGELMKTGIDAMLNSLDPYTVYYPESDIEDYRIMTTGQYGGIGAEINEHNDGTVIYRTFEGYPAQKAGIKAGDVLLEVDSKTINNKGSEDITKLLKGAPGSDVSVKIKRAITNEILDFKLKREEIKNKNVPYFGMIENGTAYIRLSNFTENASLEVEDALKDLKTKGAKKIVLDVRGNPGGLMNEAISIVNLFVAKGEIILETKGKIKDWDKIYRAVNNPVDLTTPMVVLTDRGSASASEIVSGALQDLDRAVVIGQRTFGKGLVQQTKPLSYNAQLKVTVAKYYIPSGRCVQALDYSNRDEDGLVVSVPDSLISAFKTKGGRIVYDGAGVSPDKEVQEDLVSPALINLVTKNILFDFATKYCYENKVLKGDTKSFRLSDEEYQSFIKFAKEKKYDYKTRSEEELSNLEDAAKKEKIATDILNEIENLKKKLENVKREDLNKFKAEIKPFIENEIVSRYAFETGRIDNELQQDKEIKAAMDLLNDNTAYTKILSTIEKPTKPFSTNKRF